MTVTIDKFGRVLIPKAARKELGLAEGAALDLEVQDNSIVLVPQPTGRLVEKGSILVWETTGGGDFDIEAIRQQGYEERHRRIMGFGKDA